MHIELKFFETPSHGYLKVEKSLVKELKYRPTKFSFASTKFWFLEEDVDAPKMVRLLQDAGYIVTLRTITEYHPEYATIAKVVE